MPPSPRIPAATYRIQFHPGFGFRAATAILPYLQALGITDLYASPYLKARPGSLHGYDIVAHDALNPEVGSAEDFEAFTQRLRELGMGQILDIVPNHMCVESSENRWWQDLLENGPSSVYARTFDIDWSPRQRELKDKVLIPVLGDQYGNALEKGELRLFFTEGAFSLHYFEHSFPIMPKSYGHILGYRLDSLERQLGSDSLPFQEYLSIITALQHLPDYTETEPERVAERYREQEVVKRRLAGLAADSPEVAAFLAENLRFINGRPGVAESFDHLDQLLAEQVYRVAHWRVATEEINYRRFFDINALGAIRVEEEAVFAATHRFILALVGAGKVTGLRVDHVDGLYDPTAYLQRLQEHCARVMSAGEGQEGAGDAGPEGGAETLGALPCYIVGEKILQGGESLPKEWPVHGTTGYDFLNSVNGLFVDSANGRKFDALYGRFLRHHQNFPQVASEGKRLVMQVAMSSEINNLSHLLNNLSGRNRHTRDFTLNSLTKALVEVIAFFPVYRSYIKGMEIAERDRQIVEQAVAKARRNNPAMVASIFDFIRDVLLLHGAQGADQEELRLCLDFVRRFQQLTGPVMAKGVEDTACYVYNRLLSLNEVGGAPDRFGGSVASFHRQNQERLATHPQALLATSTHDTKRSEDVRARINVLSELPELWRKALSTWSQFNRKRRREVDGQQAPSRNEEYRLYQTLLGVWPHRLGEGEFGHFRERIKEYMRKAIREAKVNSSWVSPNPAYEEAVDSFIDAILDEGHTPFLRSFQPLAGVVRRLGIFNSLAQTLLKITAPGVPDFYQGSELLDLSLVDPDNRRPVDYARRAELLRELQGKERQLGLAALVRELLAEVEDGRAKLFLTWKALTFRKNQREIFAQGDYLPLPARGGQAESVVAFARLREGRGVVVAVPRLIARLLPEGVAFPLGQAVWGATALELPEQIASGSWRNIFTDEVIAAGALGEPTLPLAALFRHFPVALLEWQAEP